MLRILIFITAAVFASITASAQAYTEKAGGAEMSMIPVSGGSFIMGSNVIEKGRMTDEHQHKVKVPNFFMGKYEVTQAQYLAVTGSNPSVFAACGPTCPVTNVSWIDAIKFCNTLSEKAGLPPYYTIDGSKATANNTNGYRLPTEAEWEYAARATTATMVYAGDMNEVTPNNCPELGNVATYSGNSCVTWTVDTAAFDCSTLTDKQMPCNKCGIHPVGEKKPNAFGLYDMIGNVWEWCFDFYGNYFPELEGQDETMETVNKTNLTSELDNPQGAASGRVRVRRGGAWNTSVKICRAAKRSNKGATAKDNAIGFRVCRNQ